jgi:hypothetical protein
MNQSIGFVESPDRHAANVNVSRTVNEVRDRNAKMLPDLARDQKVPVKIDVRRAVGCKS